MREIKIVTTVSLLRCKTIQTHYITKLATYHSEPDINGFLCILLLLFLLLLALSHLHEIFLLCLVGCGDSSKLVLGLSKDNLVLLALAGHVLGESHGVILNLWFRLDRSLDFLGIGRRDFLVLVDASLGLFGLVLVRTPVAGTAATLLDLLSTAGSAAAIVGALAITGRRASSASVLGVAVVVLWLGLGIWLGGRSDGGLLFRGRSLLGGSFVSRIVENRKWIARLLFVGMFGSRYHRRNRHSRK